MEINTVASTTTINSKGMVSIAGLTGPSTSAASETDIVTITANGFRVQIVRRFTLVSIQRIRSTVVAATCGATAAFTKAISKTTSSSCG